MPKDWFKNGQKAEEAGYQEGELVEDASMVEATPQGMMEENVESVQKEPSREQLEVIALEIFKQPLEQLNEEQLMVVYQAAWNKSLLKKRLSLQHKRVLVKV